MISGRNNLLTRKLVRKKSEASGEVAAELYRVRTARARIHRRGILLHGLFLYGKTGIKVSIPSNTAPVYSSPSCHPSVV